MQSRKSALAWGTRLLLLAIGLQLCAGPQWPEIGAVNPGPLALRIEPTDVSLVPNEPLVLKVYVENVGDTLVRVPSKLGVMVWFDAFNSAGQKLTYFGYKYKLVPFTRDEYVGLAPRSFIGSSFTVSSLFHFDRPDVYTVVASFLNDDDGARHQLVVWTGAVKSTPVKILVTQGKSGDR